jgi:predicted enzyme related to lactoylglutathione lyase
VSDNAAPNNAARLMFFEIGSRDPGAAEKFYQQAFGWRFTEGAGNPFSFVNTPEGSNVPFGTVWDTKLTPAEVDIPREYVTLVLEVDDLRATCAAVEAAGGKITVPPTTNEDGTFDVAHVRDTQGNLVGLFSMKMSPESAANPNPVAPELVGTTPVPDALRQEPTA